LVDNVLYEQINDDDDDDDDDDVVQATDELIAF